MENEIGRRVHDKGSVRTDVSTAFQESDYGGSCSEPSATGLGHVMWFFLIAVFLVLFLKNLLGSARLRCANG